MTEFAIRTHQLTRDFGSVRAIDSITLEIPTGVVFGLLGPNGAGKTTMVRLLSGLLEPTLGTACVLDYDTRTHGDMIRRNAGMVMEETRLYEQLTALENLNYYGRIAQMDDADLDQRSHELLEALNLWERRLEPVAGWSRGMKRRLAVARALMHRPRLLFMDEPSAGLDPVAASLLHDELVQLAAREGATIFLTTHRLDEAERLCALIGVIREGRLLAVGPTADFRNMGGVPTLEITGSGFTENMIALLARRREVATIQSMHNRLVVELKDSGAQTWPLINLLVESGADIEEVHKSHASLESVFLNMMQEELSSVPG